MLLKLENETLARVNAEAAQDIPDFGVWQAQEPRGTAVRIANDINLAAEEFDPSGLELIVLDFPKYKDGRAYTQARTLRECYGFEGDIRAAGDVLRDQVLFMARCGFTSFELADGVLERSGGVEGFEKSLKDFDLFYQPGVKGTALWRLRGLSGATEKERLAAAGIKG
ncbi:DUF934 domain-containing protein [Parvularcula flava]|uniref:DUF934 domain-containing protein n=1 Tax=Aquisalinus luteolus TaxID=1566827 RepID=A0A8J3A884_9PROT|nr:DUF934 domain-containing protein [Aquisalinus luteolus]NHK28323.1 DUF934 domain-containing protein [Aquisalinus luteolus]GGH98129.1 hypothetical protein GCM10011355_20990 [Aquisalinus luteolus]